MIIAIDGYEANTPNLVGIGRYAYSVICNLHKLAMVHTVRVYFPDKPRVDFPPQSPNWQYKKKAPKKLWTFIGLPLALATDFPRADVVFSPTHYIPRFTVIPTVMAIMDLSFLRFPELFKAKDLYQLKNWTKYSIAHAGKIITISEYSKRDIINIYKVKEERVAVVYPGLSLPPSMNATPFHKLKEKYGIDKPFILSVGTLQPRKNYTKLIEAFSQLKVNQTNDVRDLRLIIVGKKGWLYEEILSAPRKYKVEKSVRFLEFVPDEDLAGLYKSAECFTLPSLFEGFGLPVLEAMANKCPVVVSATSSLPEIAGSAGIYVRPDSAEDIATGLAKAIDERGKESGEERIQKGLVQSRKFTWENAAKKTLDVLESMGKGTQ